MAEQAQVVADSKVRLVLVTHQRQVLEVECDEVTLPGKLGYFGVLPGHAAMIALLKIGELMYRIGKIEHYVGIGRGFCEVIDDTVTVLVRTAELPQEVDVAAAQRELAEAEALLPTAAHDELDAALARVDAAVTRIQIAGRLR